jgi:signal transduction histidine kinase
LLVCGTGGFSIIDVKENIIKNYHPDQNISSRFFDGLTDRNGNLWVCSGTRLFMFDLKTNSLKKLRETVAQRHWAMVKDNEMNIWVVTDNGLKVVDPGNNSLTSITTEDGLSSNYVSCIYKSRNGEIWTGGDKGISIINPGKNEITNLSKKEGLVPETMFDFVEVNNRMYAGSLDGLIVITRPDSVNKNEWGFYNYGKREGFPFNDYNQMSAAATRDGESWWGVTPMLTILTQEPFVRTDSAKTHITGITIMDQSPSFDAPTTKPLKTNDTLWTADLTKSYINKTVFEDSGYYADHKIQWDSITPMFQNPIGLKLPHDQNSLRFSFTNMNVTGRDKILYRYVLEGADEHWSASSSDAFSRNYYNLKPGEYSFKVASKGFNGRWGKPDVLNFVILSPWWATWWAYSAYIITLGVLVFGVVHFRSQQLKRENRILEERVNHRTAQLKKTIDELRTTQSQLIQSEKMASLGELTAGIAHEIQNPLNFVNNFSEVSNELIEEMEDEIQKGNLNEAKAIAIDVKQNMEKILQHGKRADSIVKGMLQHSRNGSGHKELTDLNALCDEYLRLAYHGYRAKDKSFNAQFKTDFDPALGKVRVIPQDMGRVMLNLINNAFYAVNEKGKQNFPGYEPTVIISTKKNGNTIEIKVSDNGPGVSDQIREKIFQPFFSTKPTGQGTGLGLSLSYDIVKAHHGEIKIETRENVGTEFLIALPI